ncbi:MAG: sigma-70 family RNA polymerase sigma factor [Planctomycetota bacterium]|nr:MAG: sigma-70 family RNA polymerase sigma factor [Planctomycetota bacterium]
MTDSPPNSDAEFVQLLTAMQMPLAMYVRSLLPGDPAAADVTQQANARIWEKRGEFELGTNFRAWAFSIARHEVLNYRKQQARDRRLSFSEELEQLMTVELSRRNDDWNQRLEALEQCLQRLRPQQRQLLMARYTNRGSLTEHAKRLGRSADGLRVTLHRLRNKLLECIERKLKQGEIA